MVTCCFLHEKILKLLEFRRVFGCEVIGLAEIFSYMVKFPSIFGKRRKRHHQPGNGMTCTRHPAVVIDAAVSEHLEVLSGMRLLGFRVVEGIDYRCSIKRS